MFTDVAIIISHYFTAHSSLFQLVDIFHRANDLFSKNYSNQPNERLYQIDKYTGVSARDVESEWAVSTGP